jgi:hypothetical protein
MYIWNSNVTSVPKTWVQTLIQGKCQVTMIVEIRVTVYKPRDTKDYQQTSRGWAVACRRFSIPAKPAPGRNQHKGQMRTLLI